MFEMTLQESGRCDGKIMALFRDWQDAERAAAAMPGGDDGSPEKAAVEEALDRAVDILDRIANIPAGSLISVALKAYLLIHSMRGSVFGEDPCAVSGFSDDWDESGDGRLGRLLLADMGRLVPYLTPLVRGRAPTEVEMRMTRTVDEIAKLSRKSPLSGDCDALTKAFNKGVEWRLREAVAKAAEEKAEPGPGVIGFGEPEER
jgi:hypothetical protein